MKLKIVFLFYFVLFCTLIEAQQTKDSISLQKIRTQSGIDPTRIVTRLIYSISFFDRSNNRAQINNRLNLTLGVDRWSFSLKPELITRNDNVFNGSFETGAGDLRFSILNAFYVKKKHALAASAEFVMPTGRQGFGSQYFSVNPGLTYSYTINQTLFFAIQPQYLFHLSKVIQNPNLSVFTLRTFLAKFTKSGWFMVFEPRIINDFENDNFDLIIAPIVGKSLEGGFNITSVLELPTKKQTIDNRGVLVQLGITKNF